MTPTGYLVLGLLAAVALFAGWLWWRMRQTSSSLRAARHQQRADNAEADRAQLHSQVAAAPDKAALFDKLRKGDN